jgi:AAA domain
MSDPLTPRQIWDSVDDPAFKPAASDTVQPAARPFTVLTGAQLRALDLPPQRSILGDLVIAAGQLSSLIGQAGTGKSRALLQIALSQILGWRFAGLPTHGPALRWLLMGNENSIYRLQSDFMKMTASLSPAERDSVDSHILFQVIQVIEDSFLSLASDDTKQRWLDTMIEYRPDVVSADPFGEVMAGDVLKDADVRATLRTLSLVCRRHSPDTAIVILHHARTGRANIAQAVGWDKANFGLGSKALYSGCRSVLNVAPADPEDPGRIVLTCGKANDAKPFAPVGLRLNETTMLYDLDPSFDLGAWKDDVDGKTRGQSASIQDVLNAVGAGAVRHKDIVTQVVDATGCSARTAKSRISDALEKSYLRRSKNGDYRDPRTPETVVEPTTPKVLP